jgi:hypothetical protein
MKHYSSTGRRNHGGPLKRLLDTGTGQQVAQLRDIDGDDESVSTSATICSVFPRPFLFFDPKISVRSGRLGLQKWLGF